MIYRHGYVSDDILPRKVRIKLQV